MHFTINIEPSGRSFDAQAGETLLSAAIRQGVGLPYGCRDGTCGSCKCRLVAGEVVHGAHQERALSAEEEKKGFVLTCCAAALGPLVLENRHVTDERSFPVRRMPARVISMERRSHDVMVLRLAVAGTEPLQYHAGQYIDLLMRDGSRRSYSMACAPGGGDGIELHIRHMPGGRFTDLVFGTMKEKDVLRCEGPFGSFYLREDTQKPMVFLASGTGFAPIKALIERVETLGIVRATTVYWGGRRAADLYMHEWMLQKAATLPGLRYIPVLSAPESQDAWTGRTGYVHQAVVDDFPDMSQLHVYACGAPIVIDSARRAYVEERGLPPEAFYADAFTSQADRSRPGSD